MLLEPLRPNKSQRQVIRQFPVQFPVGGWNTKQPLAAMDATFAVQLKNWFPQPGYGEVRRGYRRHAWDIVSETTSIETLMAWRGPASSKMFAAAGGEIYDVTANAAGTSVVTGLSNDRWQEVNFSTSSGHYLYIVNGEDSARHYNGTTWATPAITGLTSADAIHINIHKRRVWFVEQDTTSAWYLATDAVAGAATEFQLGQLFTRGGFLMAMGTWTRDGGSGSDDYAVFISSEGQVALYQGTDPSSANTWALVGVFDCPQPIGRRCFFKYGADLALLTMQGVFPLSQLLSVDESQTDRVALSDNISPSFTAAARSYHEQWGWDAVVYPHRTMLIVNIPTAENETAIQYVMNTLTGAWCEFDGHQANCWLVFGTDLYFGANDGTVYQADVGALDYTAEIVAVGQSAYNAYRSPLIKRWSLIKPLVVASGTLRPEIGISTDFAETDTLAAQTNVASAASVFDTAVFDSSSFQSDTNIVSDWVSVSSIGSFGSIKFRARVGAAEDDAISRWDTAVWDSSEWAIASAPEEVMQINGFLVMAEIGGNL
jgi:hypothetical protein